MGGAVIELRLAGPDRYCPDCHRWLVRVHDDGTFDLAANAGLSAQTKDLDDPALVVDAECYDCNPEKVERLPHMMLPCKCWRCRLGRLIDRIAP